MAKLYGIEVKNVKDSENCFGGELYLSDKKICKFITSPYENTVCYSKDIDSEKFISIIEKLFKNETVLIEGKKYHYDIDILGMVLNTLNIIEAHCNKNVEEGYSDTLFVGNLEHFHTRGILNKEWEIYNVFKNSLIEEFRHLYKEEPSIILFTKDFNWNIGESEAIDLNDILKEVKETKNTDNVSKLIELIKSTQCIDAATKHGSLQSTVFKDEDPSMLIEYEGKEEEEDVSKQILIEESNGTLILTIWPDAEKEDTCFELRI